MAFFGVKSMWNWKRETAIYRDSTTCRKSFHQNTYLNCNRNGISFCASRYLVFFVAGVCGSQIIYYNQVEIYQWNKEAFFPGDEQQTVGFYNDGNKWPLVFNSINVPELMSAFRHLLGDGKTDN